MLPYTTVNLNGWNNISYGDTQDRISYGNYEWFYKIHKALQDTESDLAVSVVFGDEWYDKDISFAVNLVKPVTVGFYTDQEPKERVMILSAHHCLKDPEQVTKDLILSIRPECFEVLGQDFKAKVTQFASNENISKLRDIIREHYAKKTNISNSN